MATWSYNSGSTGGLSELVPYNGGMGSLADEGNALNVDKGGAEVSRIVFTSPGASFSAERTTGVKRRRVVWNWLVCADNEASLWSIEALIDRYVADGREFTLSDGTNTNNSAVLSDARPASRYMRGRGSLYLRRWTLIFTLLRPNTGTGL